MITTHCVYPFIFRSVVCSRHFKPEDFKAGVNKRILKTSVSPSIFEDYPKYMQINKRPRPAPKERSSVQEKSRKRLRIEDVSALGDLISTLQNF